MVSPVKHLPMLQMNQALLLLNPRLKKMLPPLIIKMSRVLPRTQKQTQVILLKSQLNLAIPPQMLRLKRLAKLIPRTNLIKVNRAQTHQIIPQVHQIKDADCFKNCKTILCMLDPLAHTILIGRVSSQSLTMVSIGLLIYHLQAVLRLKRKLTVLLKFR